MKPFFLFSTPRSRGTLLVRMLDGTSGVRCAGEAHDFLARVKRLHRWRGVIERDHPHDFESERPSDHMPRYLQHSTEESWNEGIRAMLQGWVHPREDDAHWGLRDVFSCRDGWAESLDFWSWLQTVVPDARLLFLSRDPDETERSMEFTHPLWVPQYGSCLGNAMQRVRAQREAQREYHALNPSSTLLLDAEDLLDYEKLSAKLGKIDLPLAHDAWQRECAQVLGDAKSILASYTIRKAEGSVHATSAYRLAAPAPVPQPTSTQVYTLRYGNEPWIGEFAVTLEDWCIRHGMELKVWSEWNPSYPCDKFVVLDMLRNFLAGDAEQMMFVDADVSVHPLAPRPEFGKGFHIAVDALRRKGEYRAWSRWCQQRFTGVRTKGWRYRNSGVWVCDRASAQRLLDEVREPFYEGTREQHHFNWWLLQAQRNGMAVPELPPEWNRFPRENEPAWFFHAAGRGDKIKRLAAARDARFLPQLAESFVEQAAEHPFAIVYPWLSTQARWEELQHSLRSIEQHWRDKECPIYLFADRKPEWLEEGGRVRFLECPSYAEALARGVQIAERVLWMNDDIYLLEDMDAADFAEALTIPGDLLRDAPRLLKCSNSFRRGMGRVALDLHHRGFDAVRNFSTHTPYLYEREKAIEALRIYGVFRKIPFETVYHNHHRTPLREMGALRTSALSAKGARFLNHSDRTLSEGLIADLRARFPQPAAWERVPVT